MGYCRMHECSGPILTDKSYEGKTIGGGNDSLILLDRKSNTTERHTREILRHE